MNKKQGIPIIFITIELLLFILIQISDTPLLNIFQFISVVLACLFVLLFIKKDKDYIYTQIGLICTVCADLFLVVIKPMYQVPAMCFFSITQICYALRIFYNQQNKKDKLTHLIIRSIASSIILIITIIVLKNKTDFLSLISVFYYINLIINILYAFIGSKNSLIFAIGLLLFACCDLLIGLEVLNSSYIKIKEGSILYYLCNPGFNLAWCFYVPSQVLIALSIIKNKEVLYENK